ncbi:hypothetical protein OX284_005000 [Flavobacterium sp. SUN046]|uniref:hypothetical protein n=1 Tax=Flavobacterium sp. SUN046 TaxID=3002440 RepID=UPI002DB95234|nr:hypothetical protein [Flavobacterium sp. SUN046]MEC4048779.1 hypothetical protein [Flavobacterium sp. SUN046]
MENNQDEFIQASIAERQKMLKLFKQNNVTSYIFTDEKGYDKTDGLYTATTTNTPIIFEVKNRDISSTTYDSIVIGRDKVDYLLEQSKITNNVPYVFWFFNDNKYYYQKLDLETYYTNTWLPVSETTMGSTRKKIVEKPFVAFKINPNKIQDLI